MRSGQRQSIWRKILCVDDSVLDAGFVGKSVFGAIFSVELGKAAGGKNAGGDKQGTFAAFVHGANIQFRFSFAKRKDKGVSKGSKNGLQDTEKL